MKNLWFNNINFFSQKVKQHFKYFVLFYFLTPICGYAQNLIPNPGFEEYNDPTYYALDTSEVLFEGILDWFSPTFRGSVIFHSDTIEKIRTGNNPVNLIKPHTGDVHASVSAGGGGMIGGVSTAKFFLQTQLINPLEEKCYYKFSLHFLPVAVTWFDPQLNNYFYTANRLGAYFSKERIRDTSGINEANANVRVPITWEHFVSQNITPQIAVLTDTFYTDTTQYTYFEGSFQAMGEEEYLTIGNFYSMTETAFKNLRTGNIIVSGGHHSSDNIRSIFYIDDLSLISAPPPDSLLQTTADTALCSGEAIVLRAEYEDASDWLWNTGETTPEITVSQPGTYTVTATCPCGHSMEKSIEVSERDSMPEVQVRDSAICQGEVYTVQLPDGPDYFLNGEPLPFPSFSISDEGMYELTVSTLCEEHTLNFTLFTEDCETRLFIPNAFTPNGDRRNDRFEISIQHYQSFHLHIFNRWGELIFESRDPANSWDGRINGQDAPAGVYSYLLEYVDRYGKREETRGTLHLLR